jgi:signal transduction histidine kinase/CheY-like chemotaxis protein
MKDLKMGFFLLFAGIGLLISFGVCLIIYVQFHVSVYLPIVSNGKTVGLLGVDYDIAFAEALKNRLLIILITAFFISSSIIALLSLVGSRLVLIPIHKKEQIAKEADTRANEIQALAKALKSASASKSAFLANISHEMRTPLNAIIGLSSLMLGGKEIPEAQRENITLINDSGMMLLMVINDILEINKIEAGKLEIIPIKYELPDLINDATALYAMSMTDKPVLFELEIDETLPLRLFGDELRIRQICNKLLNNAFKFTSTGSISFCVSCKKEGLFAWLTIDVKDTGIGINKADLERLFSDYGQIDTSATRRASGTGLGLGIAKQLAELMDGTLTVSSEYEKGSTFTLRLQQKIWSNEQIGPERVENLKSFIYSSDKRERELHFTRVHIPYANVLIVDDVHMNQKIAKGIMKPYGMRIDCVSSGEEAVDLVRKGEIIYDLIFMDYMMPEMDGIEATRIIRKEIGTRYAKTVPIIALTATELDGKEAFFLNNGFNAFMEKPIDIIRLDTEINRWIRGVS